MEVEVYTVAAHWRGDFDETAIEKWAADLFNQLGKSVSLGLVFVSPSYRQHAPALLDILRIHARIPNLVGASSHSLVQNAEELENTDGFTLSLHHFPETEVHLAYIDADDMNHDDGDSDLATVTQVSPQEANGWILLVDPFHLKTDRWLESWNRTYGSTPIIGGLAMGDHGEAEAQLYLNGRIFDKGMIAVGLTGKVGIVPLVSQGCDPVGDIWTITKANHNIIFEIGNRPAFEVLGETFSHLPEPIKDQAHGNIFAGMAISEYVEEFKRGDFLVRNLIGGDPASGAIVVGALPRVGQTLQFQIRNARAATVDLDQMLERTAEKLEGREVYGGCLFVCTGRGEKLFTEPSHDAREIMQQLGLPSLNGFFCSGEIGPVGGKAFLHGYTASLAIFADVR